MSAGTGVGRTYLTFKERSAAPATPSATYDRLYFKSDGLHCINSAGVDVLISASTNMTTATDPLTNAACTTAIVDAYVGTIITTTTTGNSQTIGSPTATAAGRLFTVVNNDTSTNSIPIVANGVTFTVTPGEAQTFIWDGSAWGPIDMGITSLPVPYNQGGTGVTDDLANYNIWVDGGRSDSYTADGSLARPYKTVLAAVTVINADTGKNWVMNVASGTYADNITITGPRYLSIRGQGVTLSGTILINSGVGSYDRIEFVGVEGGRAEKGPALTISGAITATRTDDSLIYVGFHGCLVSGEFLTTTDGTWVLQYENCRVNGAITGTFTSLGHPTILVESYGFNEFVGTISGKLSLYNCNGSDFYANINTTPWNENRFNHCSFAGSVSIIPQGGAASTSIYVDDISYKSFAARTPTITGATYSHLQGTMAIQDATSVDIDGGSIDGTTIGANSAAAITGTTITTNTGLVPDANDGAYLGQAGTAFSDLFLAEGGVINWDSGDATITQTGDTLALAGADLTVPNLTLGDAGKITLDVAPASDHTATGIQFSATAGEALAYGNVCYLKSDGKYWKIDADAAATMPATVMALATIAGDAAGNFLDYGWARDDSWSWTIGGIIYASTDGGGLTQTAPSGDGDQIQIAGKAETATVMKFAPSWVTTEVGLDIEAKNTGYTITWAELTAVPKVFTCDSASDQVFTFAAPTAADAGKQFWLVKSGTDAGKWTLDAPTGVTLVDGASVSADGGTIACTAAIAQSALFLCVSATKVIVLSANATLTVT